ncbi:uroporphyrinogen decarboxylase [Mycolicibacterium conceptionense]|uniref:Uroporphyrinogen decarboxylase n=1 Tax=Mycolicibacterium conceptionense TaxID=451644 RepID=A0A0U1DV63_9MYCO|nr:uroporphyrinogen decarboxylase [Mycolicibacterium conceptionense]
MNTRRELPDSPYLAAVSGRIPRRVPVWFMRQAGRSLPEYRALRAQHRMLEACFDPELVCEITLQPVRRHGVDAAILFSDIVVPLKAAGIGLDIVPDVGPVIEHPIRSQADVEGMKPLEPAQVSPVTDAVAMLVRELGDVPLIGFAGAPFTLASYLVEGGPSRHHERTKAMMLGESATWHALMGALTDLTIAFLQAQVDAGVDALQVFDSWAGTLSLADYRSYVLPHTTRVFATMAAAGVPMTHFASAPRSCWGRCPRRWALPRPRWSAWTGAPRWSTPRPGSSPAPPCRATSIRWCCWRAGRWPRRRRW